MYLALSFDRLPLGAKCQLTKETTLYHAIFAEMTPRSRDDGFHKNSRRNTEDKFSPGGDRVDVTGGSRESDMVRRLAPKGPASPGYRL